MSPRRNGPPLQLDRFVPYGLSVLTARITARLAREYEKAVGLPLPEARVMTVLGSFRPVSSNAVVQHTSMDKATVSRAIARLIRLGLVTRKPNSRDRRLLVLDFTPAGRRAYAQLAGLALRWEAWFTAELSATERGQFVRTLARLRQRLDEEKTSAVAMPGARSRPASRRKGA
jgi:DNA-binding MarR family transcriptional regulator